MERNMSYSTTSGFWYKWPAGATTYDSKSWGVPVELQSYELQLLMSLGWFPSVVTGSQDYDVRYQTQTYTETLTGQVVTVAYSSPSPVPLADAKTNALTSLCTTRYAVQTGGATINGIRIKTDPDSLTLISGAKAYVDTAVAAGNSSITVNFKTSDGTFLSLNQTQVDSIAYAVAQHVQACFSREAALAAEIMAATDVAAIEAIDLSSGWPT
jgi:hypothetical protein